VCVYKGSARKKSSEIVRLQEGGYVQKIEYSKQGELNSLEKAPVKANNEYVPGRGVN